MSFSQEFSNCCQIVQCTNIQLSKVSGVDPSVISRLKQGSRDIGNNDKLLTKLCDGLLILAEQNGVKDKIIDVYDRLSPFMSNELLEHKRHRFSHNLDVLMSELSISNVAMARFMNLDSSLISRIRNGQRYPSNDIEFARETADLIVKSYLRDDYCEGYLKLFGSKDINDENIYSYINSFLLNDNVHSTKDDTSHENITNFLNKLNDFDLGQYIKAVKFDEIKLPTSPFTVNTSKMYIGIDSIRLANIDFLKTIVLNKNPRNIIMYSDLNVEKLAKDTEFSKKWMIGLAMVIKRGCKINIIHCLDRSFEDMMIGLESWIPLYMTGQITPYYFKSKTNNVFGHTLFTAEDLVALEGSSINGYEEDASYYLTKKTDEVVNYYKRSKLMIKKASPLMNIYREENREDFLKELFTELNKTGDWNNVLSTPSLATMSIELLKSILDRVQINDSIKQDILANHKKLYDIFINCLSNNKVHDIMPLMSEEEFRDNPIIVQLPDICVGIDIRYTYEEYKRHLEDIEIINNTYDNYTYEFNENSFSNIQIYIHKKNCVLIIKGNTPVVAFNIHNEKLCNAFENMNILYWD